MFWLLNNLKIIWDIKSWTYDDLSRLLTFPFITATNVFISQFIHDDILIFNDFILSSFVYHYLISIMQLVSVSRDLTTFSNLINKRTQFTNLIIIFSLKLIDRSIKIVKSLVVIRALITLLHKIIANWIVLKNDVKLTCHCVSFLNLLSWQACEVEQLYKRTCDLFASWLINHIILS